ncbi:hypothetical protein OBBRIDRAFT_379938 [Obba rivulosa]|uniref:F-box domain-containing protein n=1 Tax=Obba rivulosa TaxID=1052685 RepID=A0A8E2B2V8_9APHY|nr:hypothetical protein OBBRIDRAFT_379938 [Obba rivulosa]
MFDFLLSFSRPPPPRYYSARKESSIQYSMPPRNLYDEGLMPIPMEKWPHDYPRMRLNFDILTVLMVFLLQAELLALMSTCRTLRLAGIRRLVNIGTIIDDRRFHSFMQYMHENRPSSYFHLKCLKIDIGRRSLPNKWVDDFVKLMREARFLSSLTLIHSEDFLRWDPKLAEAIIGVKSLKELIVSDAAVLTYQMGGKLRSSLEKLTINHMGPGYGHMDPSPFVSHCQDTLEELHLSLCDRPSMTMSFPRLRTLEIEACCRSHHIHTDEILGLFPNLRNLTITMIEDDYGGLHPLVEGLREMNIASRSDKPWPNLDEVVADVLSLYSLALPSRVHRLVVYRAVTEENAAKFAVVLEELRPTWLMFKTTLREFDFRDLPGLLPRTLDLTHLSITVDPTDSNIETPEFDTLLVLLRSFQVRYLDIRIHVWLRSHKSNGPRNLKIFLNNLDREKLAARIADINPSLEFISIEVIDSASYFQKSSQPDESSVLRAIGASAAQKVMREESFRPIIWC